MAKISVLLDQAQSEDFRSYIYDLITDTVETARRDAGLNRPFLKKNEAATFIGISVSTLDKWINVYGLPVHTIEGTTLISKQELGQFILSNGNL